jgi:transcriptional regulator with XRE-family HTH domain
VNVSKIDQFCKLHGLSRTDLEAAAGLSNGAIGKWERSIYGPLEVNGNHAAVFFNDNFHDFFLPFPLVRGGGSSASQRRMHSFSKMYLRARRLPLRLLQLADAKLFALL